MLRKIKTKLKSSKSNFIDNELAILCYKSRFLSSIYYTFFSSSFGREHQSVLAGKVKHLRQKENYYLLVRNTHRIEKGLLMQPRKNVFAKEYIGETVIAFENILNEGAEFSTNNQLKWFHDVLNEYFNVVSSDTDINKIKGEFVNLIKLHGKEFNHSLKVPYNRRVEDFSSINYDEFFKLVKQRRSVRWFTDQKVPRELIDKAILSAAQSPSACNRQPFEFRVIDDKDLIKEVVDLPMGTRGYGHSIPVMIVAIGNLDAYFSERDRHLIYIDASLANMAMMLAFETMGLSSCSINWPDIEGRERKMSDFLNLKQYQRPVMCLGVGFPDMTGMVAYSEKRELNDLRKYNI